MIIDYLTISPGSAVTRYGITVGKKKSKDYKLVNKHHFCESVLFKLVLISNYTYLVCTVTINNIIISQNLNLN